MLYATPCMDVFIYCFLLVCLGNSSVTPDAVAMVMTMVIAMVITMAMTMVVAMVITWS